MTNLADLLPAGGGQNNTDFVADGNISAGVPVVLTAAGRLRLLSKHQLHFQKRGYRSAIF